MDLNQMEKFEQLKALMADPELREAYRQEITEQYTEQYKMEQNKEVKVNAQSKDKDFTTASEIAIQRISKTNQPGIEAMSATQNRLSSNSRFGEITLEEKNYISSQINTKKLSLRIPQMKFSDKHVIDTQKNKDIMALITEFSKQSATSSNANSSPHNDSMNNLQVAHTSPKKHNPYSKFGIKKASLVSAQIGANSKLDPHHLIDEGIFENSSMSQQTLANDSTVIREVNINDSKDNQVVVHTEEQQAGEPVQSDTTKKLAHELMKFIKQIVRSPNNQNESMNHQIELQIKNEEIKKKEKKDKKKKKKKHNSDSDSGESKHERKKEKKHKAKKKHEHHGSGSRHKSKDLSQEGPIISEDSTPQSEGQSDRRPDLIELPKDGKLNHKYKGRTPSILIIQKVDESRYEPKHQKSSLVSHTKSVGGSNLLIVQDRPSFINEQQSSGSRASREESKESGHRISFMRKSSNASKFSKVTLVDHAKHHSSHHKLTLTMTNQQTHLSTQNTSQSFMNQHQQNNSSLTLHNHVPNQASHIPSDQNHHPHGVRPTMINKDHPTYTGKKKNGHQFAKHILAQLDGAAKKKPIQNHPSTQNTLGNHNSGRAPNPHGYHNQQSVTSNLSQGGNNNFSRQFSTIGVMIGRGTKRLEDFGHQKPNKQSTNQSLNAGNINSKVTVRDHFIPDDDQVIKEQENDDDGLSYTTFGD
ncbi:hypothetical protein FGO68_gene10550 [Halteria grandinella]|uniref:Uncharacterized protein n=1 Tax=Halteria grandinella TaxID=5974 RepID=A0A8J8P7T2_HALGN|nr:hypothetical protein FGO68_gene10550 [Halteria grandinella]